MCVDKIILDNLYALYPKVVNIPLAILNVILSFPYKWQDQRF